MGEVMKVYLLRSGEVTASPYVFNENHTFGLKWDEHGHCWDGAGKRLIRHDIKKQITPKEGADIMENNLTKGFYKQKNRHFIVQSYIEWLKAA